MLAAFARVYVAVAVDPRVLKAQRLKGLTMTTGIVRKIDDLGRIVIPAEMRRVLGIREGDELEIGLDGDHVEIRPRIPTIVHEFTLEGSESINIDGARIDLAAGEYIVERLRRSRD